MHLKTSGVISDFIIEGVCVHNTPTIRESEEVDAYVRIKCYLIFIQIST